MHAQTGDAAVRERVRYIVAELARCQAAHGDGYVGGTTVERGGEVVDGKIVFEELRRGDIRAGRSTSTAAGCRSTPGTRSMPA